MSEDRIACLASVLDVLGVGAVSSFKLRCSFYFRKESIL